MPINSGARYATANPVMPPAASRPNAGPVPTVPGQPSPEMLISRAQTCERQGDVRQARHHFQQAFTMWPGHVEVLRAAARMEDRLGQLPMAEHLYQQAVRANPQHSGALNDLGLCLARQGKLEPSLQVLEQAIQLQPTKSLYRNNAATVLVEMRQDQKALAHLSAVHGSASANFNLGQLLVQRGRSNEAAPYFIAAIEQQPDLQAAHEALAKLQGASNSAPVVTASKPVANNGEKPSPTPIDEAASDVAAQPAPPAAAPSAVPQPAPQFGPQFGYPATALSPEVGHSTSVAPGYYPPTRPFQPTTGGPRYGAGPHYLPPVANQPGGTIRR
jgi:tetratricopeptide (TPR) repeat protein